MESAPPARDTTSSVERSRFPLCLEFFTDIKRQLLSQIAIHVNSRWSKCITQTEL